MVAGPKGETCSALTSVMVQCEVPGALLQRTFTVAGAECLRPQTSRAKKDSWYEPGGITHVEFVVELPLNCSTWSLLLMAVPLLVASLAAKLQSATAAPRQANHTGGR